MNRNSRNPSRRGEGRKVNSASIVSKHEKTSQDSLPKYDDNSKVLKDCGDRQPSIRSIGIRFPALEFLLGKFGGPSTVIYRVRYILCFFRNPKIAPNAALPNSRWSPEIERFIY